MNGGLSLCLPLWERWWLSIQSSTRLLFCSCPRIAPIQALQQCSGTDRTTYKLWSGIWKPSCQDIMLTNHTYGQGLTFVPNVAYHAHTNCLLATFHIRGRGDGGWQPRWLRVTPQDIIKGSGDIFRSFCGNQNQLFFTGSILLCDHADQNRHFEPDHFVSLTLNKWFTCVNLTRPQAQRCDKKENSPKQT